MASSTALEWLYSTQLFGIKLGLGNVHRLLMELGLPPTGQKFIHVAGTNGKGSACAFMHSILSAAGIKAGLFTSPHLIRFNERIRDGERTISDAELEDGINRLRELVQDWNPHPTFFELTFALAMDWFRQRDLPWVILETGMGGRLDATNAITPAVSVITSIGLDHQEILGDTLAKIANEKAGIIKPGVPVVTQAQDPEVQAVITRVVSDLKAPVHEVVPWAEDIVLGLPGPHQRINAALAVSALRVAGISLSDASITAGLRSVQWPCRFQRLGGNGGQFIIDGAHNLEAAQMLVSTWQEVFPGEKAALIFGVVGEKDSVSMLKTLAPIVAEWHFTGFQSPRALDPNVLAERWRSLGMANEIPVSVHGHVANAVSQATNHRRLIAGSLYLAGEALALLEDQAAQFETSLQ